MATATTHGTIEREGVSLYYEVAGEGPVLLLIPGGPQDAGVFAGLVGNLASTYTVISYDPRGNSRSPIADASKDQDVEVHADDAAAVIEAVAGGAVHVFGTSGGAQIAMALAAKYPDKIRTLVLHEPATVFALADPSSAIAADQAIVDTYREHGVEAGIAAFFGMAHMNDGPDIDDAGGDDAFNGGGSDSDDDETMLRVMGNFEYFLAHGLIPLSTYRPDIEALKANGHPIVVGVGAVSTQATMQEIAERLAEALDAPLVVFPGDHTGFSADPEAFASILTGLIAN